MAKAQVISDSKAENKMAQICCSRESYCLIPNEERLVAVEHAMFTFDDLKVNSHDDRQAE